MCARFTLLHYLDHVVITLLHGAYDNTIGRELMAATARLCDLCAFMSFDSGRQRLTQRYYIQALRLAQASGHRALGAHILADMSMQAHYLGDASMHSTWPAPDSAPDSTAAHPPQWPVRRSTRPHARPARRLPSRPAQACTTAERVLDRAMPADDRLVHRAEVVALTSNLDPNRSKTCSPALARSASRPCFARSRHRQPARSSISTRSGCAPRSRRIPRSTRPAPFRW